MAKLQPLVSVGRGCFVVVCSISSSFAVVDISGDVDVVVATGNVDVVTGNVDVVTGPLEMHFKSGSDIFPFLHLTIFVF